MIMSDNEMSEEEKRWRVSNREESTKLLCMLEVFDTLVTPTDLQNLR